MAQAPKNKNKLTDKQQLWYEAFTNVDNLKTFGDAFESKLAAGYSSNTNTFQIINSMPTEILEAINTFILSESMKAAKAIVDVRNNPAQFGAANKIKAASDILDRGGIVKKQQVEIVQDNPSQIFIIPAKTTLPTDESED